MKNNIIIVLLLFSILFIGCNIEPNKSDDKPLEIFGEVTIIQEPFEDLKVGDTVYHTIPYFEFINQNYDTVTKETFEGDLYVANFFFVTCPTICPKMTNQLGRVQRELDSYNHIQFLSHTVNPDFDTPELMSEYAKEKNVSTKNWHFVTGAKEAIYEVAKKGYFTLAQEDEYAPGGFLHSQQMFLIDNQYRIRGIYDGIDSLDVNRLIEELKLLHKETYNGK